MPVTSQYKYTADLARGVQVTPLGHLLFTGDKSGDVFCIRVQDGGKDADLTGATVNAYLMRADHVTVPLTGETDGSDAVVTLNAACYAVPGRCVLVVKLSHGDVLHTIFAAEGAVMRSSTDAVIDQEGVIPSLEELLAQIAVMEQATASANAAADNANAAAADALETAAQAADNANRVAKAVQDKLDSGELVGKGLQILGYYDTADALAAGVASPEAGDAYGVGTGEPYDIYVWDALNAVWVNNGAIQGPQGEQGVPGATGPQGAPGRDGASARRNLLDNSDFRNPVNQRGATSYTGSGVSKTYTIDRWATWQNVSDGIQITADGITIADGVELVQYTASECFKAGKTYTFAAMQSNGELSVLTVNYGSAAESDNITVSWEGAYEVGFSFYLKSGTYEWAALYEGEYTADTLPEYIPKGYTAELMECQRYYLKLEGSANVVYPAYTVSATQADVTILVAVPMRITPTLTVGDVSGISVYTSTTGVNATAAVVQGRRDNAISLRVTADVSTAWRNACARFNTTVELSADL